MNKFYVTTPIYYINDVPHIGHAYTTVAADILARYYKQKLGDEQVFFLTGTDEHGAKVATAAKEAGKDPKEFADSIVPQFESAWSLLNIKYSHFFRTTDQRHEKLVQEILQKIYDKGFIYEGVYEGLYCEGCEKFLTEDDLVDGKCPLHPKLTPIHQKEKNYFFKLSAFKKDLIELFSRDAVEILPISKKNEILGKLKDELKDIAISREGVSWGIPIPWDNKQTIYVWVEALFNYYTATQFLEGKQIFWPADIHLIGKDILWFHTVIWCALLGAAELALPKTVFAHGFFTINGAKMSKSLGNVISPKELVDKFGVDASRYLLVSQFPFGQDGDFSIKKLEDTYNTALANGLGNLVARVAKLCEDSGFNFKKDTPSLNYVLDWTESTSWFRPDTDSPNKTWLNGVKDSIENYSFYESLIILQAEINLLNQRISKDEPWTLLKNNEIPKLQEKLDIYVRLIIVIAILLGPFMPETSEKILKAFSGEIKSIPSLFPRI